MNLLSYFRAQRKERTASTANVAKERLQILVAHERATRSGLDWLPALQEELLTVLKKYIDIDREAIQIELDRDGDCDILGLNITLPER